MRILVLIVVMLAGFAQAQTTRPAAPKAPPPTEKGDAQALPFLQRGLGLLEAGNNEDAAVAFADGLLLYLPAAASASGDSMIHAALNHGSAVASFRLNKLPPARQAIDRALLSRWTNDSLVYNAATILSTTRGGAISAVNLLDRYLAAHPDADEKWVNLFGLALEKAAVDAPMRTRLEPRFASLAEHQARLEAREQGLHRWGSEWFDDSTWEEIRVKKDDADKKLRELEREVAEAQRDLQNAQSGGSAPRPARTRGSRGGGGMRPGGGGGGGGGATSAAAARERLTAAQKALESADRGPQPVWNIPPGGIQPVAEMTLK